MGDVVCVDYSPLSLCVLSLFAGEAKKRGSWRCGRIWRCLSDIWRWCGVCTGCTGRYGGFEDLDGIRVIRAGRVY